MHVIRPVCREMRVAMFAARIAPRAICYHSVLLLRFVNLKYYRQESLGIQLRQFRMLSPSPDQ